MKARMALTALLAGATLLGLGCKTTIIDTGAETRATYQFGKLTAEEPADIDTVYQAAERAMTALGVNVVQKVKDALQAEIVARDAQDKKITIKLLALTNDSTRLTIDVGSVDKARRIYQTIRDNLAGAAM